MQLELRQTIRLGISLTPREHRRARCASYGRFRFDGRRHVIGCRMRSFNCIGNGRGVRGNSIISILLPMHIVLGGSPCAFPRTARCFALALLDVGRRVKARRNHGFHLQGEQLRSSQPALYCALCERLCLCIRTLGITFRWQCQMGMLRARAGNVCLRCSARDWRRFVWRRSGERSRLRMCFVLNGTSRG